MDDFKTDSSMPYRADIALQPGDIVFCTDSRGHINHWSTDAEQMLGYAGADVLGREFTDALGCTSTRQPIDVPGIIAGRDLATGLECRHKDGTKVALYLYATVGLDADGTPAGAVFVARDVTEYWRAEEAVRASESRYRLLFENATDSIAIADSTGRVLEANPACLRIYGYTADEVRRMNLADVVAPEGRAAAATAMATLGAGGTVSTTIEMVRKDGTRFTADLLAYATIANGEHRIYSFTRDVTEQRRAAARTTAEERKYRSLFDAAPDGILLETLDGRILAANQAACRLLGYSRAELLSRTVADLTPPEMHAWLPSVRAVLAAGKSFRAEVTNVRKDGSRVAVELSITTMEIGAEQHYIAVLRDVEEKKRAEQALRASEELYRAVFENTGAATIVIEADTTITRVNAEFSRRFGWGADEVVGHSWTEFAHPDDLGRMREYHDRRRRDPGSAPRDYGFRLIDKLGQARECHLFIDIVPGTGRSVASILDLTAQKQAERELAESRLRYRGLFHNLTLGVYRTTPDGRVLMANPALLRMLGYDSYPDFVAHNLDESRFAPQTPRRQFIELIERDGEVRGLEATWKTRDGRAVHVRESAVAVRDEAGKTLYYDGSVEELAGPGASARLREFQENLPIGVFEVEAGGRLTYANLAALRLLGCSSFAEMAATRPEELYADPADRELALQLIGHDGAIRDREFLARRRDGTTFLALFNVRAVFGPAGRPVRYEGTFQDLSGERRLEQDVGESAANFRALAENSYDGIAIAEATGAIAFVNARTTEIIGYPKSELVGVPFLKFVHPDHAAGMKERLRLRLSGQSVPSQYRLPVVRKSGEVRETEVTVSPTTWHGRPAVVVVIRDVTEGGVAEADRRRSEAHYRATLDALTDAVYVTDAEGTILLVNRALVDWLRELGLPADVAGRRFDLVMPFVTEAEIADFRRVAAEGRMSTVAGLGTVGERLVATETTRVPVFDGARVSRVVSVARDVSERLVEQKRLQESEDQFRRLVELSPDGIAVHQAGRVVMANGAVARLLGFRDGSELVGRPVIDWVHPDDRAVVAGRMRAVVDQGVPGPWLEERFLRADGSTVTVEATAAPFQWRGQPAVQVVVRDISERRRLARMAEEAGVEFRAIIDNAPEGVVAECDGRIAYCNAVFARMFGYDSPEHVVGMPAGEFDAPEDRDRLAGYSAARLRGETAPTCYTFTGLRRDGTRVPMAASISTYRLGDRDYILGFVRELPPERCQQRD
jgi:PAS domain S-box-containing protein